MDGAYIVYCRVFVSWNRPLRTLKSKWIFFIALTYVWLRILCVFLKLMVMSWLSSSETFQQVVSQICPACHDESTGIGVSAEESALSGFGIGKSKKQHGA